MRPGFSLRLFLIAITLLAVMFGAAANFVYGVRNKARRHQAAIEQLEQLNCTLSWDSHDPNPSSASWLVTVSRQWIDENAFPATVAVHFQDPFTPEAARHQLVLVRDLGEISDLTIYPEEINTELVQLLSSIAITGKLKIAARKLEPRSGRLLSELKPLCSLVVEEPIDSSAALAIAKLPNLEELTLDISNLTPDCANGLNGFPKLQCLTLFGRVTESAPLAAILECKSLEILDLGICNVTDDALASLDNARNVTQLWIARDEGNAQMSSHISKMTSLKELHVSQRRSARLQNITAISKCTQLVKISLTGANVTEEQFAEFRGLPFVENLSIEGNLSDAEVMAYLNAVPMCRVEMNVDRLNKKVFTLVEGRLRCN